MIPGEPSSDGDPLVELAEEFAERYRRGERPALSEYVERYPELAERIRKLFPAMVVMEEFGSIAGPDSSPPGGRGTPPQQLGEYRILREVGRGGMGVVYEAVQESLGRHVALKVLPAQNWKNAVHIERFRREARAVARLHHTNIVPVFGVGESDGVHYYAMQYIHGQSLDNVLDEVRRLRHERSVGAVATVPAGPGRRRPALSASIAQGLITGEFPESEATATATFVASPAIASATSQATRDHPSRSAGSNHSELTAGTDSEYPRGAARLGIQAAEALSYAHGQGILHRDIKPSNLLLDTRGTIWVTDFGLAKTDDTSELTRAGDIVGTVRYMAPERFRGEADPRSDVYALGLTLYEMLTLRPAFDDSDRPRLMEAIARRSPPAPRGVDAQIPRDLETIVLKAIAKDPAHRYATAADLAEDLRRFLADRPILARRTTWAEHGWRWCRRNPVVAGLLATIASLLVGLVVVLAVANSRISGALEQEKRARSDLEQTLYYQWIAAAADARDKQRNALAEELLDRCPERLRGFEWHYLKNLPFASRPPIHNGDDVILPMRYSPDGRRLAVGTRNGRITVWDIRTGKPLLAPFQAQKEFIRGAAFSPDGRYLATGGQDDRVKLWDSQSGALVREFPIGRTVVLLALAFSPDGRRLAASDQDRQIHVWDLDTDSATTLDASQPLASGALAFSSDGQQLLAVGTEGMVTTWSVGDVSLSQIFDAASPGVVGAAFSPDHRLVALGCEDGTIKVLQSDPWKILWRLEAHTDPIHGLAFGAGGSRLASSSPGATIRFWDMRTGQEALSVDFAGQRWNSLAFSPDGNRMAAGSAEGEIRILDGTPLDGPGSGGQLLTLEGHRHMVDWLSYSPDGRRIASASWDGTTRLWDADTGRELRTLFAGDSGLTQAVFDQHGGRMAAAGWDGVIRVWHAETGADLYPAIRAQAGPVYSVAFDREGRTLVSAHHDGTVRIWDASTGRPIRVVPAHAHPVLGLAFSPDGRFLVTAGGKGLNATVWRWGPDSQEPVLTLDKPSGILCKPVFSRDGARVAAITRATRAVWLWDVTPGGPRERDPRLFTLPGTGKVNQAIFHNDGRLVIASDDQIQVLDPQTGAVESLAAPHAGDIGCAVLSPDGKFLATGTGYRGRGEIRVWELARFRKKE